MLTMPQMEPKVSAVRRKPWAKTGRPSLVHSSCHGSQECISCSGMQSMLAMDGQCRMWLASAEVTEATGRADLWVLTPQGWWCSAEKLHVS